MNLTRRQWLTMAAGAFVSSRTNATDKSVTGSGQVRVQSGYAFGSDWHLTISTHEDSDLVIQAIEKAVTEVNQSMSPYLATSELSMFNRLSSTAWCDVSAHFAHVLNSAMQVANLSGNAFDPTLGPVVNRFGFGPINGALVTGVNHLDVRKNRVRKLHSEITLDLCAIAKGYALDLAASNLRSQGTQHFLLEMGGELLANGHHPSGRTWQVAVEDPIATSNIVHSLLPLHNQSIATSGIKHNAYTVDERRYSHLMDGNTQQPVVHSLASVTVLAESAMLADAWSTALMVAGRDRGLTLANTYGINALFLECSKGTLTDELVELRTAGFPAQAG